MARTRERSKGRRGGEGERFSYLPESVLQSPALATAPHAAIRVLAILTCGRARDRNGTMMCTDAYAARFGLVSRETLARSLALLEERGLIERTRRVMRFRKASTLWAVCWWPVCYRDGQPLATPEPASHRYLQWSCSTPTVGVERPESSHRPSNGLAPIIGAEKLTHHTDLGPQGDFHHTDYRGHSKNLGAGRGARIADLRLEDATAVARLEPDISAEALAKRMSCPLELAHRALQRLQAGAAA